MNPKHGLRGDERNADSEYARGAQHESSGAYHRWIHHCPFCLEPVGNGPGLTKLPDHLEQDHDPDDVPP